MAFARSTSSLSTPGSGGRGCRGVGGRWRLTVPIQDSRLRASHRPRNDSLHCQPRIRSGCRAPEESAQYASPGFIARCQCESVRTFQNCLLCSLADFDSPTVLGTYTRSRRRRAMRHKLLGRVCKVRSTSVPRGREVRFAWALCGLSWKLTLTRRHWAVGAMDAYVVAYGSVRRMQGLLPRWIDKRAGTLASDGALWSRSWCSLTRPTVKDCCLLRR